LNLSKVFININGDSNESGIRCLNEDNDKRVLKQSSIDSFLISVKKYKHLNSFLFLKKFLIKLSISKTSSLGSLNFMKIWHDNSGYEDNASWFMKYIIVYDLETKDKFYFVCEQWLAAERGDGKIERNLISIHENEFKELKGKNQVLTDKFSDLHLWYSVFKKPIGSLLTRLNRVTCCFLSVYLSMLLITIYYTANATLFKNSVLVNFSFLELTVEQVKNDCSLL
jgi:hypothetical protein